MAIRNKFVVVVVLVALLLGGLHLAGVFTGQDFKVPILILILGAGILLVLAYRFVIAASPKQELKGDDILAMIFVILILAVLYFVFANVGLFPTFVINSVGVLP